MLERAVLTIFTTGSSGSSTLLSSSMAPRAVVVCLAVACLAACGGQGGWQDPNDGDADGLGGDDVLGQGDGDGTFADGSPDDDPPPAFGLASRPPQANCRAFSPPPVTDGFVFVDRFPNIELDTPTGLFQRPGDNTRWYVTERAGRIVWFPNDPNAQSSDLHVALDISDISFPLVDCSMGSLAFPPDFATSHVVYVGYCYQNPDAGWQTQVRYSRFSTPDGGNTFPRETEELIVALDMPLDAIHDAPGLHSADVARFGPDGYLYIALGDGGPMVRIGGEQAQDTYDLRGKLLRIDVSDTDLSLPNDGYIAGRQRVAATYPADNPFAAGGGHPSVYAYGFRNPWQWHFDGQTGAIWLGDVGNMYWEEVNRGIVKGGNYGWGYFEGTHCCLENEWTPAECAAVTDTIPPLLEYAHGDLEQEGRAVTGGLVYRGDGVPSLTGSYIFGDSSGARIWAIRDVDALASSPMPTKELLASEVPVSAFAVDQEGELFAVILYPTAAFPAGKVLALQPPPPQPGTGGPPQRLSETGCFDPLDPTRPASDLIPFAPVAELWSDGASKRRWMVVPDAEVVTVNADGDFSFPPGSVLVKEFSLDGKRVETRFLVHETEEDSWAGYTYAWNADESDALLVGESGALETFGSQTWLYPARAQCSRCHTKAAGDTLGPEVAQLNHALTYDATGQRANQMATLEHIGLLAMNAYTTLPYPQLHGIRDSSASVEERARSYLHANCASCHREGGTTFTEPDFRYDVPLDAMGICDVVPTISDVDIENDPRIFAPGAPDRSVIWARMKSVDAAIRMPPLARSVEDELATDLVYDWIAGVESCP